MEGLLRLRPQLLAAPAGAPNRRYGSTGALHQGGRARRLPGLLSGHHGVAWLELAGPEFVNVRERAAAQVYGVAA